jgi:hypothetical protein
MNEGLNLIDSKCKFCQTSLEHRFIDIIIPELRHQINNRLTDHYQDRDFLLPTYVCANCFLVQVDESYLPPVLERAYVSSFGASWLPDIKKFTDNIFEYFKITDRELSVALINRNGSLHGVKDNSFNFGTRGLPALIDMYGKADTITCHDELAHVHDVNDFVSALKLFLKPTGVISMEFLYLLPILEGNQVRSTDSACFPYLSLSTVDKILRRHELVIFDVGNYPSQEWLRILIKHASDATRHISNRVTTLRGRERSLGMFSLQCYDSFKDRSQDSLPVKNELYFHLRQ